MSTLRTARTSAFNPIFARFRRSITTRGNNPQSNREKQQSPFPSSSLLDNAPGWSEDLATPSEAFVKADRATTTLPVDEMQKKTVDHVQQQHANDPEVEPTHAPYAREEVGGPLGSAGMAEFEGVVGDEDLGPDEAQVEANGRVVTRRVTHEKTTVREGAAGGQAI